MVQKMPGDQIIRSQTMKRIVQKLFIILAMAGIYQVHAAVTFTITPAAISNTYGGTITLQVSGITAGSTVVMQKFLDANTNGVIDSGDILGEQFQLTDGSASVFTNGATHVTNFAVPGDTDGAANGAITATLYPGLDFAQLISGQYFFKLSSPNGQFSPITNSFTVTNFPFAQKITGNVVNNGTNVPNAVVILFEPAFDSKNATYGTVANNLGNYTIEVPPGGYELFAVQSNFVENLNYAPNFILGAGQTVTTNITLTNATATITGKIADTNNPSLGLPGMLLACETQDNMLTVVYSDTNGNYTVRVTADLWRIQAGESADLHGYVELQGDGSAPWNTTTGNVAGATIFLAKATGIFYGTVTNSSGPMPSIDVSDDDNTSAGLFLFDQDIYTTTNGNYVIGTLANDSWEVAINAQDQRPIYTNYLFSASSSQENGGSSFINGQAISQNFTGILATNYITGTVVDSDGNPVPGVGVNVNATIGSQQYQNHTDTATNGTYSINVANGTWDVSLNCGGGGDGLNNIYNNVDYQCPNDDSVFINNSSGTGNFTVVITGGQISGYLLDDNGNPVAHVTVSANDGMGHNDSGITDDTGFYYINAGNGSWDVTVDCDELTALGYNCPSDQNVSISDNNVPVNFSVQAEFLATPTYPFTTLHNFAPTALSAVGLATNSDGLQPSGGLVLSGTTLFGTTSLGGTNGAGTVFAISTTLSNYVVVHTFSAPKDNQNSVLTNNDGGVPLDTLVLSSNILYGTAANGGLGGNGTVFRVGTNGANYTLLHTFTAGANNHNIDSLTNSDGANSAAPLVFSSSNLLYSTSINGGTNGNGTIYLVTTNGSFSVLHTFMAYTPDSPETNSDGAQPNAGLVLSGNTLYGTTSFGGSADSGTIFSMNTNGTAFTVLYNFTGGNDGGNPYGGLVLAGTNLFGTAIDGGAFGDGTVFAINTNGNNFTVLHTFTGGNDGARPRASLLLSSNLLYGTTYQGGLDDDGTVFAINPNTFTLTVLYAFTGGSDGSNPQAGLLLSSNTLYGTATSGGPTGGGSVFALSVTALPTSATLAAPQFPAHNPFQATVYAPAGGTYTIQMSTNLLSTNWIPLLVTNPVNNSFLFSDPNATNKQRFYRVLSQ